MISIEKTRRRFSVNSRKKDTAQQFQEGTRTMTLGHLRLKRVECNQRAGLPRHMDFSTDQVAGDSG